MPNFQFGLGLEGWTGTRREGTVTNPHLIWDSSNGYPANGSLRQDALDQTGVDTFNSYGGLTMDVVATPFDILIGDPISWFFRIQNRIATERRFYIWMVGATNINVAPVIDVAASSTSPWIKVTGTQTSNQIGQTAIGFDIGTIGSGPGASYRFDGYFSVWVDNVFYAETDPTPPPPVTADLQPSTGGIPWAIKEDI